jgi:hypothetical protein
MIAAMLNIKELQTSVLIVVIEPENLERMKTGDPCTLESLSQGGILAPPLFPLNLSTLIAYEPDTTELYIKAQGPALNFLQWLERGRRFIEGKDGSKNSLNITPTPTNEAINQKLLDGLKLALKSFEENWAIDWDEIAETIREAEEAKLAVRN